MENDVLCSSSSSSGAGYSEACALVVGSASHRLADVYRMHGIRWKLCKKCGINNQQHESQDAFESELVLGADQCFVCSANCIKEQQQEMIKDCHSDDNDDDSDGDDCSGSGESDNIDGSCVAKALQLLDNQATKSSSASGDKSDT